MNNKYISFLLAFLLCSPLVAQTTDWSGVEKTFGRKGAMFGDVFKIAFPRTDLHVTINKVYVEPTLALTSWIAFKPEGEQTMIMGDLVLLQSEVPHVMTKLLESGIEITALHNHLLNELPHVMYMHFEGHGTADDLAQKMKSALSLSSTPMGASKPAKIPATDWTAIEKNIGRKGTVNGSVYQIGVPRADDVTENGMVIPPSMGVATSINFEKIGKQVASTGDFVLVANEVNPVINTLTKNGIAVTAIHNHMLNDAPRLFFVHFLGYGSPEKIGSGLKAALEKVNVKK